MSRNKYKQGKNTMIDWVAGTVILTLFPTIGVALISVMKYGSIDMFELLGNGELVLAAFLITIPSLIGFYISDQHGKEHRVLFYSLLFTAFFELIAYTTIKTTPANNPVTIYSASIICMISSLIVSWNSENVLRKE